MNSINSQKSIFFKNNSVTNVHFKNSKSHNNYNHSKTDFQDNSTMFSSINSIITYNKENNLYTLKNQHDKPNIKTRFMLKLCNGTFYPRTLKSKKYLKEIRNILPPLITISNNFSPNSELQESLDNFNTAYHSKGSDLSKNIDKINESRVSNQFTYNLIRSNRINLNESKYISNIFKKDKKENCFIGFKGKTEFESPQNSLMTLKVNKSIIKKISEDINNYQYQTYATIINNHQKDIIKLCMMPKPLVKGIQYHINMDINKNGNKINSERKSVKKPLIINKNLIDKINKKIDNGENPNLKNKSKKKQKEEEANEQKVQENQEINKTINSTVIRNSLIFQIKYFYCKCIPQSNNCIPNSRMEASFTPFFNGIFLYGGLQTQDYNDLWFFNIENKRYTWERKIIKNENVFNSRSAHTAVLYNDCLYIYGGNINLKRLKNQLEDILIYNIRTNTLKSAVFKNDKNKISQKYLYIPLRRNHIAHVIGWNMIVYGGIDVTKEFYKENNSNIYNNIISGNAMKNNDETKIESIKHNVLGDFMALDLNTLRWMNLSNIFYKTRSHKKLQKLNNGVPRVYHSSCLVIKSEHYQKGNKLNIYKSLDKLDEEINLGIMDKEHFEIDYEGIYIFGGLDENLIETNTFFILHCFRNPLIFFEPKMKGTPPSPRYMASMNFNEILNFITIYGGKDSKQIFGDLFILDIMNFHWLQVELFGTRIERGRIGHCSQIINDKLFIFGGCDENNKYLSSKVMCIELDLIRNKKLGKIYDYANLALSQNPKDKTAKNIIELLNIGAELPKDIYPLLKMDN